MAQSWTVDQHIALDRLAGLMPAEELATHLARWGDRHSARSVVQQAATADISLRRRGRRHDWTDAEDAAIRRAAGAISAAEIAAEIARIPGCWRSAWSVRRRAVELGVRLRRRRRALGIEAVRHLMGVSRRTVIGWVEAGQLRAERPGAGRNGSCWRFRSEDVEAFIREHTERYAWRAMWPGRWRELGRIAALREPWLSVALAADALRRSEEYVKRRARAGRFVGALKVGRAWAIPMSALQAYRELQGGEA